MSIWVGRYFLPLFSMSLYAMTQAEHLICSRLYVYLYFFLHLSYTQMCTVIQKKNISFIRNMLDIYKKSFL